MSGMPSLTILSEEQKFNGDNLLQWNTNITQLLGSKELSGYIDGKIKKPGPESIPLPTETTTTGTTAVQPTTTPIYSTTLPSTNGTFMTNLREDISLSTVPM